MLQAGFETCDEKRRDPTLPQTKRLVKLACLKDTYGTCMIADLMARYPECALDELERDLNKFSYN